MAEPKRTILPADPDDLICDTCPERFAYFGDMYTTFERARVRGWHIYQHVQIGFRQGTGERSSHIYTKILCPTCIGTPRSRLEPAPLVLEGQADILEELGVQLEPVEKERKPKKGKEMP